MDMDNEAKFIQIARNKNDISALDSEGNVWCYNWPSGVWFKLPSKRVSDPAPRCYPPKFKPSKDSQTDVT